MRSITGQDLLTAWNEFLDPQKTTLREVILYHDPKKPIDPKRTVASYQAAKLNPTNLAWHPNFGGYLECSAAGGNAGGTSVVPAPAEQQQSSFTKKDKEGAKVSKKTAAGTAAKKDKGGAAGAAAKKDSVKTGEKGGAATKVTKVKSHSALVEIEGESSEGPHRRGAELHP